MKNVKLNPRVELLVLFVLFSFFVNSKTTSISNKNQNVIPESEYVIRPDNKTSSVSDKLVGFNVVYPHETDVIWQNGKLAGYLKDIQIAFLRYPGGTVCSYYHWNALTGEGWKDSWDPANPVTPKSSSQFMDLDEYMKLVRLTRATPLVGINMSSGWRWNRQQDGLDEAIALMQYCKDKNFKVEYWFLDNEPYQHDSNGGAKTPEQYAELINTYVPVMKAFNPNIKIIANWNSGFKNKRTEYNKLIQLAGANIDVIDVHWYWNWNNATWKRWLEKTPMVQWTGDSYVEDIGYFHQMAKELGHPNIKLASFEWNIGSPKGGTFTPSRIALAQAEMMMQFISGGLDMSIMWPMHWPDKTTKIRSLYNESTNTINPDYQLFKFFGKMQGGKYHETQIIKIAENMVSIAVQDVGSKLLRICVLNKNTYDLVTDIRMDQFTGMKFKEAKVFTVNDDGSNYKLEAAEILKSDNSKGLKFKSKSITLTMITFEKK